MLFCDYSQPGELAGAISGKDVVVIDNDGGHQGGAAEVRVLESAAAGKHNSAAKFQFRG